MATFNDALDLRTAVIETVADASIADIWPRLVGLAEAKLGRVLRTRYQLALAEIAIGDTAPMPADFLEMSAFFQGGRRFVWNPAQTLSPGVYQVEYYAELPTLANDLTSTNWLLQNYPDVYIYAVAEEAARHKRDLELVGIMKAAKDEALASLYSDDERARFGQAVVRVNGPTP